MSAQASEPARHSRPLRIVVVGGGIAGLTAAHRLLELADECGRTLEISLLEAGDRLGGTIETREFDGYLVEAGPDSFITQKPAAGADASGSEATGSEAIDLCRALGLAERLIPTDDRFRRSLVLRRGRPVPVPEGFLLLSPARIWPVLRSPIFSLRGKLRMAAECFLPRRREAGDESLGSFVRRRFGNEALQRLVQPLVG
ncbi:MAG: protoporphyrinogen oxidase, partial [Planctomycetes bacterium]|nr:protoporphyrinogen oxidase [Planctomycetota bacterium]